jgi:spore germination protein PE
MEDNEVELLPYPVRTAHVAYLYIISASQAASVQIGDRATTDARLRALAVQREEDHISGGNAYFEAYSVFSSQLPAFAESDETAAKQVAVQRINCSPQINVGCIKIIAAGSASSIQLGNGMQLRGESRIKHIRQFAKPGSAPPANC